MIARESGKGATLSAAAYGAIITELDGPTAQNRTECTPEISVAASGAVVPQGGQLAFVLSSRAPDQIGKRLQVVGSDGYTKGEEIAVSINAGTQQGDDMSVLKTVDMVISISEDTINYQFSELRRQEIIEPIWNIVTFNDGTSQVNLSKAEFDEAIKPLKYRRPKRPEYSCAFYADVADPTIKILNGESNTVLLSILFQQGTMHYWSGFGPTAIREEANMEGWVYAFGVGIGSIKKDVIADPDLSWMLTDESRESVKEAISTTGLDQKYFTVESLFLDLENANYLAFDAAASNFKNKAGSTIADAALLQLQSLLSNYFQSLKGGDNPYILGYALTVNIPDQQEAMFQPTALRYSATFSEKPGLSAFNYLMMTGGNPFSTDQDLGVFRESFLTDPNVDGELTLSAELFCAKMFDAIGLGPIYTEAFAKLQTEPTTLSGGGGNFIATMDPLRAYDGEMTCHGYGMDATLRPYVYSLEGTLQTGNASRFHELSSIVPIAKFFGGTLAIEAATVTTSVWLNPLTTTSKFTDRARENYTFGIAAFNDATQCAIGLGVADYTNTQQKVMSNSGRGGHTSWNDGHCNTTVPPCTIYQIAAGFAGKITVTAKVTGGKTESEAIRSFSKPIDAIFTSFHENMKKSIEDSTVKISEALQHLASSKIILPCAKVYAYKDLRFEWPTDKTRIADNTVKVKVSYDTVVS